MPLNTVKKSLKYFDIFYTVFVSNRRIKKLIQIKKKAFNTTINTVSKLYHCDQVLLKVTKNQVSLLANLPLYHSFVKFRQMKTLNFYIKYFFEKCRIYE